MKPILFSTPMVQAILDGKKTQTRRVIKIDDAPENWNISIAGTSIVRTEPYDVKLPRYAAGDILWVRETFFCEPCTEDCAGRNDENECPFNRVGNKCYGYKTQYAGGRCDGVKWRPSIHMPREAARIFLRVKTVRVERLQDITPKDAWDEGCRIGNSFPWEEHIPELQQQCRDILFIQLWDSLNAKRGYGWDANPWVWVIEFEREEVEE
jgi:hypothetical protein